MSNDYHSQLSVSISFSYTCTSIYRLVSLVLLLGEMWFVVARFLFCFLCVSVCYISRFDLFDFSDFARLYTTILPLRCCHNALRDLLSAISWKGNEFHKHLKARARVGMSVGVVMTTWLGKVYHQTSTTQQWANECLERLSTTPAWQNNASRLIRYLN